MRKLFVGLLSVALAVPVLVQSSPAGAISFDVICPATMTFTFEPGSTITTTVQAVSGEVTLGTAMSPATPCSSLAGTTYRGLTGVLKGSALGNCLVGGTMSGTMELTADNGDMSTLAWTVHAILHLPLLSLTATDGFFKGARFFTFGVPTGVSGSCLLGPVRSLSFVGIFAAIRL